ACERAPRVRQAGPYDIRYPAAASRVDQHRDGLPAPDRDVAVRGRQVRLAVAVQVADCYRPGAGSGFVVVPRAEAAVAPVGEHGDGVLRLEVRDCEVGPAVAAQVTDRY